jgi:eukaryotic-like serine/threonine-protein kinase
MIGVHPSSPIHGGIQGAAGEALLERVPAYVIRDVDNELRSRLSISGFVLLVGDSSAGKSRTAYEAIATLPDHVLVVPQNRDAVGAALDRAATARRCIVWLDDLENYLGVRGLTRSAPLCPGGAVLLPGNRAGRELRSRAGQAARQARPGRHQRPAVAGKNKSSGVRTSGGSRRA